MSTTNASVTLPEVTIGEILVLRDEFLIVARGENRPIKERLRASKMMQLLDELIAFREKDGEVTKA